MNLTFNGYYPDTYQKGSSAQRVVDLALQIRGGWGMVANRSVSFLIALLSSPLVLGLYFALVYLNWKLRRSTAKPFLVTTGNYKQFRQQFDDLTKLVKWADKFSLDWSKIGWYEKIFAKQVQRMFATIKDRQQKMQTFLTDLDRTDIILPDGWEHKTGQELWEGRPSPYEYLV